MTASCAPTLLVAASGFRLASPLWLLAIAALPLAVWLRARARVPVLLVPFAAAWHRSSIAGASNWTAGFALGGLVLVIGALARPQKVEDKHEVRSQGYDIMLAVDLSGSMLSEDYEKDGQRINRLQAIKPVIQAFIDRRTSDRIGVVVFSSRAYTLSPLTTDHAWLARQIERIKIGLITDGTAIGDALGVALTRLDQSDRETGGKRKGAFIVLLTDGANNMGALAPMQSAQLAKSRGIPIYTIGAGKDGMVPMPNFDENGKKVSYSWVVADLDEDSLRDIAETTGGKFYRAADTDTIESAFASIDQTQKIDFQAKSYLLTTELFSWLAVPGLALFVAGACLSRPR
jgi:Ca-activated chloride channel family protein